MALSPAPAIDPNVITATNANNLTQLKRLGMGYLTGAPLYSPDGKWLFLPTTVGVFVLDTASYQSSRFLRSASRYAYSYPIDITSDGKTLVIGSDLIAIEDGHVLPGLDIPSDFEQGENVIQTVRDAKFSPDDKLLFLVNSGDKAGVWRLADGKLLYTFQAESFDISTDSRLIATTVDSDKSPYVRLYNAQTGELLRDWAGERAVFLTANQLAVESKGAIRIYDLATRTVPYAFNGKYPAFSPDGQYIAFLSANHVEIRSVTDGKLLHKLDMGLGRVDDLTSHFAPDGQTIAISAYQGACCGGGTSSLSLWDITDGSLIKNEPGGNFYFSPDGKTVDFGSQILNTSDGSVHATINGFMNLGQSLAFIDDGKKLVSFDGQKDHPFFIYQIDTDQSKLVQLSDLGSIGFSINQAGKFSAFSPYLFGYWKQDELFNELRPKVQGKGHYDLAGQILFSPDSQILATGSRYDGILRLWNIQEQRLLFEQSTCPSKMTSSLAFSPDGKQIASACTDPIFERDGERNIQVWQIVPTPQHLMELSGYGYTIVTYSPDGKYIAGAGNHVRVWSAVDGKPVFGFDDNSFQSLYDLDAQSIAFSPNSEILAFGLKDGSVELWSVMEGKRLNVLLTTDFNPIYAKTAYNPVHSIAFSPDGKLLAVGLDNGSIQLWGIK
jgi:WD40 repeat protein